MTTPAWVRAGRIPCLDGLRALAILLVLFSHLHFVGDTWLPLAAAKGRAGFLGVQVFFVLSGFLITTLALREIERTGRLSLLGFCIRRALRILPAFVTFLAVLGLMQLAGITRLSGWSWLAAMTYTVNFLPGSLPSEISHVWSLCVEEHFYLIWPVLLAILPLSGCRRAAMGCIVVAFALRWLCLARNPAAPIDLYTFTRLDDIAFGCLLAYAAREPAWVARLDRLASLPGLIIVALIFVTGQLCLSRLMLPRLLPAPMVPPAVALANTVNAICLVVFLWAAVRREGGLVGRVLEHPLAVGIGLISYSVYLWHPLFLHPGMGWLSSFPINLGAIFLVALASYLLIERPFLAWKDRLGAASPKIRVVDVPRYTPPATAANELVPAGSARL